MKISKIVKYVGIISAPLVGGRLIGKYAVQNARKDYSKNKTTIFTTGLYIPNCMADIIFKHGYCSFDYNEKNARRNQLRQLIIVN